MATEQLDIGDDPEDCAITVFDQNKFGVQVWFEDAAGDCAKHFTLDTWNQLDAMVRRKFSEGSAQAQARPEKDTK